MRYLIDTNVFINIIEDDYISDDVRNILTDYENIIYISSESIKEFIHLVQIGKIAGKKNNSGKLSWPSLISFHLHDLSLN